MADRLKRELFDLAGALARSGRSFVIATVVRRDGFTSAHQGDMAIIDDAGGFHGWVGGGCTRPTVEREAAAVLSSKKPRLIALSPEPERDSRPGVLSLPMTCSSGGTVEIYLDPVIAAPRIALFGRSPIIAALAAVAHAIGYLVDVADPDARADEVPGADRVFESIDAPELAGVTFAVVGTMGELDEEAVLRALALRPTYVGVIASRRRYALLRDALIARGVDTATLASIANPAGLDLGAREAGEVAVSILAQLIARRNGIALVDESRTESTATAGESTATARDSTSRRTESTARAAESLSHPTESTVATGASSGSRTESTAPPAESTGRRTESTTRSADDSSGQQTDVPTTAIDPVCKMTVTIATAKHVGEWDGRTFYFCCGGCKTKFLSRPAFYLNPNGGVAGGAA